MLHHRMNLRSRLVDITDEQEAQILALLNKYDLNVTVHNFDQHGLILQDALGKSVRVLFGRVSDDVVHVSLPHSDISVVFGDGLLLGWIESSKMSDHTDRMLVNVKSLHKMPNQFLFIQECQHMEVNGGVMYGGGWECLGCGEVLV